MSLGIDLEQWVADQAIVVENVIHVGAHIGQEADLYERVGASDVTWVEANPEVVRRLRDNVEPRGHRVLEALTSDTSGDEVMFRVTNNEESSSMLPIGTHAIQYPEIVVTHEISLTTATLDQLCVEHDVPAPDLLVVDVQGAELRVLRGGQRALHSAALAYLEIETEPLYQGAVLLPELDAFLRDAGFRRAETSMTDHGWGEALYVSEAVVSSSR